MIFVSLFSVIIPTYNRATPVRDTLASLFAQRFTDYEAVGLALPSRR